MSPEPTFSLIFLTWNPGTAIMKSIESVLQQTYTEYEIILVDNNSEDGSIEQVQTKYADISEVKVIRNEENYGFSEGMNIGAEASTGDYICCYNHDTILGEGYLETLAQYVTQDAVWTTARINHRVTGQQRCVRLLSNWKFTIPYTVDGLSGIAAVNYIPGDGVIIPRSIYENDLNGMLFDQFLPPRGEDVDLSLRLERLEIPKYAVLNTFSEHPDKGELYSPSLDSLVKLINTVNARARAQAKNSHLKGTVLALASILTNPIVFYFTDIPRSSTAFEKRVSVTDELPTLV